MILYDASWTTVSPWSLPYLLILVFDLLFTPFMIYKIKQMWNQGWVQRIGTLVFAVIGTSVATIILITTQIECVQAKQLYRNYEQGDYETVEGYIENYKTRQDESVYYGDVFTVKDVEFCIDSTPMFAYGYTERKVDGGMLDDGVYVKICYIPYKFENVIMHIEIVEEPH